MSNMLSMKGFFIFCIVALGSEVRGGRFSMLCSAWAGEECSVATLNGEYLVTGLVQRRVDQRDDPTLPRIIVAVWTFDAAGKFTAYAIQNFGGQYREVDQAGTYTVSSACIAVVTFPPEMGDAIFKGALTRDGNEGDVIRMDPDPGTDQVTLASRHLKKR
jgi:hypothetical protein